MLALGKSALVFAGLAHVCLQSAFFYKHKSRKKISPTAVIERCQLVFTVSHHKVLLHEMHHTILTFFRHWEFVVVANQLVILSVVVVPIFSATDSVADGKL